MFNQLNIKKSIIIITTLILIITGANTMANSQIIHYTLDNGLGVVLIHDATSPIISARTYVKAGSIDEAPHLGSGLSHYLEHIVAGGSTKMHNESTYKNLIAELGGAFNAYTTLDHTSYYINTTDAHTEKAIQTLYEWMFFCKIDSKEFEREKKVITKEIEKNNANIHRQFYQLAQQNTFKVHPLQYPVIGYLESLKATNRNQLVSYYKTNYVPANMVLAIGGNFDITKIKEHINKTFGTIPQQGSPTKPYLQEPLPFNPRYHEKEGDTNVTYFSIRFPTATLFSPDLYALDLLEYILTNGNDSILYKKLVEEKKLAYSINGSSYTPLHTNGYFEISAETTYDAIPKLKKEIYTILNQIKKGKIKLDAIKKGKKQKLAEDILVINHIEDKVTRYGIGYLYTQSPFFYDNYIRGFEKVTKNDIKKIAKDYLTSEHEIVTVLYPKKTNPIKTTTEKKTQKTTIQKIKLNNNITLLLKNDPTLPKTFAQIMTLGGIRAETKKNNGIGILLADLLGNSSQNYSKTNILTQIEGNGAHLGASMGNNTLYYTLHCLSNDFKTLLPLFLDTFYFPKFPKKEIEESKRQISKDIEKRQDDWYTYGNYHFNQHFFKGHPYALPSSGEIETLNTIQVPHLNSHHKKLTQAQETIISIMGNFDTNTVIETLNTFYKTKKITLTPSELTQSLPRKPHQKNKEIKIPISQNVTGLFMGFDGISIKNTNDLLKLDLLDSVLSGMSYPSGRLHNLLREEGLVYMVHAHTRPGIETGVISIVALTSNDKVNRVKTIINEQIKSLQTTTVSDQEFKEGIAQLKFYYDNKEASLDQLIISSSLDELYGKGFDFSKKIRQQIKNLSKKDIQDMAKKYFKNPQTIIIYPQK